MDLISEHDLQIDELFRQSARLKFKENDADPLIILEVLKRKLIARTLEEWVDWQQEKKADQEKNDTSKNRPLRK